MKTYGIALYLAVAVICATGLLVFMTVMSDKRLSHEWQKTNTVVVKKLTSEEKEKFATYRFCAVATRVLVWCGCIVGVVVMSALLLRLTRRPLPDCKLQIDALGTLMRVRDAGNRLKTRRRLALCLGVLLILVAAGMTAWLIEAERRWTRLLQPIDSGIDKATPDALWNAGRLGSLAEIQAAQRAIGQRKVVHNSPFLRDYNALADARERIVQTRTLCRILFAVHVVILVGLFFGCRDIRSRPESGQRMSLG